MAKATFLLLASSIMSLCNAQKTDTLSVFYESDKYHLTKENKNQLDAFLKKGWDRIFIKSYTDETDGDEYNMQLSKRRATEVYHYFLNRNVTADNIAMQFFGETAPVADNSTDEGRAQNRQTSIVGFRYPRINPKPMPTVDLMKPVTSTLNDGFIITYRPCRIPESLWQYFQSGESPFQLVTNTTQMRQASLYTNTTNGEILSSVMVFCGQQINPCKLDTPILIKVPIPFQTKCPIEKIKFYNTVAENGKLLWQEQSRSLYPEVINGKQYLSVWMDDFCQCINFDIKIDPDCYDVDSTQLWVGTKIKNLSTELVGLNSVYLPRQTTDSTHSILFMKDEPEKALVSFTAYNGKRYLKRFYNRPLSLFPYNENAKRYQVLLDSVRFYLPNMKDYIVTIKVNGDRYRSFYEKDHCQMMYVKQKEEKIVVDLWAPGKKGKIMEFKNQPLASIPFDATKGEYVITKEYVKELETKKSLSKR